MFSIQPAASFVPAPRAVARPREERARDLARSFVRLLADAPRHRAATDEVWQLCAQIAAFELEHQVARAVAQRLRERGEQALPCLRRYLEQRLHWVDFVIATEALDTGRVVVARAPASLPVLD